MPNQADKFFEQAAGFLEAIRLITEKGFFNEFRVHTYFVGTPSVSIQAVGYVPDADQEVALKREQCHTMLPCIDVEQVIATIRRQVGENDFSLKCPHCEVKTQPWRQWNRVGDKSRLSRGLEYTLSFSLSWVEKKRRRK
ncbi:MAG: hypothetical protein WCX71_05485 [Candidatus Buchananbacteria bacterium]